MHRTALENRSEIEEWLDHQSYETYNDRVIRQFALMAVVWGVSGSVLSVLVGLQRCWPGLSFGIGWLTFARLQPLHTNAMVYAFAGCALLACAFYCVQRTCHVRLFPDRLAGFAFWGWQAAILAAAATQLIGIIQGHAPAVLELAVGLLVSVVWVVCAIVFLATIARRRVPKAPLANWFFAAFILVIAALHVLDSLAGSLHLANSYLGYADRIGGVLQWWSGHNTEGFFLTAGFFGMVYYFLPKQAGRPIYSRRLAMLQLWALIAVYVWAGPYDLHYDSLAAWVQSSGAVFSLLLLAAAWAGLINGFLTLARAWERLRGDWILLFMIASLCCYGVSSFEGPMMSMKPPNGLPQYAGWLLGHVHAGVLGWVALMAFGALYQLFPQLFNRERMHSAKLIEAHFWLATSGVLLHLSALWIAGASSLELADSATPLPFRLATLVGRLLFCSGAVLMAGNVWMTIRDGEPIAIPVTAPEPELELTSTPSAAAVRR